jgi:hypothetical protein
MIANHAELSEDCQQELGRSMHMAFFVWQPQALLTAPCDADIQRLCLSKSKGMEVTPGAVAVCISEIVSGVGWTYLVPWLAGWLAAWLAD